MKEVTMRNTKLTRALLIGAGAFILSACVSSEPPPESFYYVLDPKPQSFAAKTASKQYKILPVIVPDYMNQPNLVLKLSDHQIKISHYHFWAQDLRRSIQRVLISELNQANTEVSFVQSCTRCEQISVILHHYYPTESGDVRLSGSYLINSGYSSQQQHSFSFTRSLQTGGYEEAVSVMRVLLDDLAININSHM